MRRLILVSLCLIFLVSAYGTGPDPMSAEDEAHEIVLTFDGWTGWTVWANPLTPSFGTMEVKGYLWDATNGNWVVNGLPLYNSSGIIYSDDETFHNSTTTTLWGNRTCIAFVTSHITATAATMLLQPGYCQSTSDTSSDHTYWSSIGLYWLN